jgi:DNA-binding beta-propeller fold protein YncE
MSVRRVSELGLVALAAIILTSCGDVYRPVVIPVNPTPPNPSGFHAVFALTNNVPFNSGAAFQIDVSGDTNIGQANMGWNPTHAAILPTNNRIFVASAGTLYAGGADVVTAFTPAANSTIGTGLGTPTTFTFPNFGPAGSGGGPAWVCSYLPDFLTTTQSSSVFVANYGVDNDPACLPNLSSTDSVAAITISAGALGNIAYLPAGSHPVALAETPDGQHLYAVNQGNGTVVDLSPTDLSTRTTISVGTTPVWAVARNDSRRVYVLSQGDGKLLVLDTTTDTVVPTQTNMSVGAGANYLLFDPHLNRIYVTNPATGTVYVYSATGGVDLAGTANDTPLLLSTIVMTAGANPPCATGCSPVSIAALPDGSRFYVASYATESNCSDANFGVSACIVPMLTVFDALSMTPKQPTSNLLAPSFSLPLLAPPRFASSQYGIAPVSSCAPAPTYAPGTTRFRMFATAATDSSHVYVSICDAGAIADVVTITSTISTGGNNAPDTLISNIPAPLGPCTGVGCSAATITSFSITSNVVTFTATNSFAPGTRVAISGLTSAEGSQLNGLTLTVLATAGSLPSPNFVAMLPKSLADVSTIDSGNAVPISPPQLPIYLLAGQ